MLSTKFAWAALAVLATSSVSATYFTAPAASTVWTHAPGQEITWKYQAGGAPQGDILLVGMSAAGTPITSMPLTVATEVDLTSESTTFPEGLQLRTATRQYTLLMVDSSNHDNVYSQIGPFEIESFAAAAADDDNTSSSSSSTASAASSASSTASSSSSSSVVSSSETSSSRAAVTATVVETASSGVLVTMTLQPSSGAESGAETVTVTESASASRAAASGAGAANAGATSGAARHGSAAGLVIAVGAAILAGAFVL